MSLAIVPSDAYSYLPIGMMSVTSSPIAERCDLCPQYVDSRTGFR